MTGGRYDVVVLVEHVLDRADATRLVALHEAQQEPVRYHVLLPVEDPALGVETAMGQLSTGEVFSTPAVPVPPEVTEELRHDVLDECRERVAASVRVLEQAGARAVGVPACAAPLDALAEKVAEVGAREVVVVTRPHLVRELVGLDWTSRAQRRLDVPVLHLLERSDTDAED